jgi:hypothetical protein
VRREVRDLPVATHTMDQLPPLPSDLDLRSEVEQEVLLRPFRGQTIKVSKVHPSTEWHFGHVQYDPLAGDGQVDTFSPHSTWPSNSSQQP